MARFAALLALPAVAHAALLGHRVHRDRVQVLVQQETSVVASSSASEDVLGACDCGCCGVEEARDSAADPVDQTKSTIEIECDVSSAADATSASSAPDPAPGTELRFVSQRRKQELRRCGAQQCRAPRNDHILEVAEGEAGDALDYARFCRAECEPIRPERNSACRRKPNNKRSALKKAFVHFNRSSALSFALASAAKPSKDEAATEKLVQGAAAIGDAAETVERNASALLETEALSEKKSNEVVSKNSELVQAAASWTTKAKKAAAVSNEIEAHMQELNKDLEVASAQAASDVVEETVNEVRTKILRRVHSESQEKAKKIKAKMLKDAPKAGAKAAAAYSDALGRAAATAGEYTKRGDSMSAASAGFQVQAGMLLNDANNWQRLGDINKAQKNMQQAHQIMHTAIGLGKKADGMYGQAKSIMGTLGDYANQAAAAAYHAEYMLNPDMPPPPVPLV